MACKNGWLFYDGKTLKRHFGRKHTREELLENGYGVSLVDRLDYYNILTGGYGKPGVAEIKSEPVEIKELPITDVLIQERENLITIKRQAQKFRGDLCLCI